MPLRQSLPALALGLAGLSVAAILAVLLYEAGMTDAKDLVAVIGIFTGVTGTLVGTFLGIHVGAAGKDDLKTDRDAAKRSLDRALDLLSDDQRAQITSGDGSQVGVADNSSGPGTSS